MSCQRPWRVEAERRLVDRAPRGSEVAGPGPGVPCGTPAGWLRDPWSPERGGRALWPWVGSVVPSPPPWGMAYHPSPLIPTCSLVLLCRAAARKQKMREPCDFFEESDNAQDLVVALDQRPLDAVVRVAFASARARRRAPQAAPRPGTAIAVDARPRRPRAGAAGCPAGISTGATRGASAAQRRLEHRGGALRETARARSRPRARTRGVRRRARRRARARCARHREEAAARDLHRRERIVAVRVEAARHEDDVGAERSARRARTARCSTPTYSASPQPAGMRHVHRRAERRAPTPASPKSPVPG